MMLHNSTSSAHVCVRLNAQVQSVIALVSILVEHGVHDMTATGKQQRVAVFLHLQIQVNAAQAG